MGRKKELFDAIVKAGKEPGNLILGPIVGGMTTSSVNIWGKAENGGVLYVWVSDTDNFKNSQLFMSEPLSPENDYAGIVKVIGLQPARRYYYKIAVNGGDPSDSHIPVGSFQTFPLNKKRVDFSFVFGSCFLPDGKEDSVIFNRIRVQNTERNHRFMLLMGDQIYADDEEKNGIGHISSSLEDYRSVYAYTWKRQGLRKLFRDLPAFMTLDDHEVDDDWHWQNAEQSKAAVSRSRRFLRWIKRKSPRDLSVQRVKNALKAYWEHQGMHGSGYVQIPVSFVGNGEFSSQAETGSFAYRFNVGAAAFFVLDTRTQRVRTVWGWRRMLDESQWKALEDWLLEVKDDYPVKFIVTSSALLSRLLLDFLHDRWRAFRRDRKRLLNLIHDHEVSGVYLLSGDLHAAHAVSARLGRGDHALPIWEFCATPFQQSAPFLVKYMFNFFDFGRVNSIKKHFVYTDHNFGVVNVKYSDSGDVPGGIQVAFEVYNPVGQRVHAVDTICDQA